MINLLLPIAVGYLAGNDKARSKLNSFMSSTLKNGLSALQSKKVVDNVQNSKPVETGNAVSNEPNATPIIQA